MKNKLSDEQVARKRKDKHAKHDAEQKQERKLNKYGKDVDHTVRDYDENEI